MTTADWLRSKIGQSPNPAQPERISRKSDPGIDFLAPYLRDETTVLHAYCGDGRSSQNLAAFVPLGSVTGVDPDAAKLRSARSRAVVGSGGDVTFERSVLDDLPLADESCDAVLITGALATGISPERALDEVRRILVPGGLLGVRHSVASSRVFTGPSPLLERSLGRRDAVLRDAGGDPDAGLRQPGLLREAGFVNLGVSASVEQATDEDLLMELARDGFVPDDSNGDERSVSVDCRPLVYSFVTVVETLCWKPV